MRRIILIAAALMVAASPVAAQHCWPTGIALIVQDEHGAIIDPHPLMQSLEYSPPRGETEGFADFHVDAVLIDSLDRNNWNRPGGIPVIEWYGRGDCRVDMREVVLHRDGKTMRLWMDLHLDSQRNPDPSDFMLRTPLFAEGTWRLDVCAMPEGSLHRFVVIAPRWVRVSPSGNPRAGWQPPRGCAGAR
ncbi:MAG TPA: hypothetical protein VF771_04450 [Longimicrobiaceae bacterium]